MARFKVGDSVLILPKFAHLYRRNTGLIASVQEDPFRTMFNEYAVDLGDGSTDSLFEFQLLEDGPDRETRMAVLVFDSRQQAPAHGKEQALDRQIVLRAQDIDVEIKVHQGQKVSIVGQIREQGASHFGPHAEVNLMKESIRVAVTTADSTGVFEFNSVPRGTLNLLVLSRAHSRRILGTFSI